jgi:hypothetical protein
LLLKDFSPLSKYDNENVPEKREIPTKKEKNVINV